MYDLEGSDSKREWVEIYNGGSEDVDISDWRFNDGSNHTFVGDDLVIEGGTYALLVSDIETYGMGANIIDTVMSLNNTGDKLLLLNEELNEIFSVTYSSEWGAAGNGNSLQWHEGFWIESSPTPLGPFEEVVEAPQYEEESEVRDEEVYQVDTSGYSPHVTQNITADAGSDSSAVASSLIFFEGEGYGLKDEPLVNARYVWNFGDGIRREGKNVSHTYAFPGEYIVTLEVSSGKYSDTDSLLLKINEADVRIVHADRGRIEIANDSAQNLDLSLWRLVHKDSHFVFPKGTVIAAKRTAVFPASATYLFIDELGEVKLLYPNGVMAHGYLRQVKQIERKEAQETPKAVEYVYVYKDEPLAEREQPKKKEPPPTLEQFTTTTIALSGAADRDGMLKWVAALISLVSVGSLIALSSPRFQKSVQPKKKLTADDFKILE
jgi:hypothetical protein